MNAGQHLGNTKAILENSQWKDILNDKQKLNYFQVLNWSPDYLSLIDIVGKLYLFGIIDYIPVILPFLGKPQFNFFSMKKKIDFVCKNTILYFEPKIYHKFHFDSLNSMEEITNYWEWLEEITKLWLEKTDSQESEIIRQHMLISLLAQTLHAIQDFYSHSNWIEYLHENYGYTKAGEFPTWFDLFKSGDENDSSLKTKLLKAHLYTGYFPIGRDLKISEIYHNDKKRENKPGLNKDRSERPYFEVVYYLAFKNGIQWLNFLKESLLSKEHVKIINDPLTVEYAKLGAEIQPYIKKIAFKLREWNGTAPFVRLTLQINQLTLKKDNLLFVIKVSSDEKLVKYDRDFRKSFIKILIVNEKDILYSYIKFGKKG